MSFFLFFRVCFGNHYPVIKNVYFDCMNSLSDILFAQLQSLELNSKKKRLSLYYLTRPSAIAVKLVKW